MHLPWSLRKLRVYFTRNRVKYFTSRIENIFSFRQRNFCLQRVKQISSGIMLKILKNMFMDFSDAFQSLDAWLTITNIRSLIYLRCKKPNYVQTRCFAVSICAEMNEPKLLIIRTIFFQWESRFVLRLYQS